MNTLHKIQVWIYLVGENSVKKAFIIIYNIRTGKKTPAILKADSDTKITNYNFNRVVPACLLEKWPFCAMGKLTIPAIL